MRVVVRAADELVRVRWASMVASTVMSPVLPRAVGRWPGSGERCRAGSAARPGGCGPRTRPVDRLVRFERAQQHGVLARVVAGRPRRTRAGTRRGCASVHSCGAVGQLRLEAGRRRAVVAGVLERAQHPGDVAQRRVGRRPRLDGRPSARPRSRCTHPAAATCAAPGRDAGRRGCAARTRRCRGGERVVASRSPSASVAARGTTVTRRVQPARASPRPARRRSPRLASVPKAVGEIGVHLGDGRAEPVRLAGEVAAGLVGVQVGLGHQVAHAGLGQLPPVGRGGHVLLQHRDRVAARRRRSTVDRARAAAARAARRARPSATPISMSGLTPGCRPAEHLEDRDVAVHQRRVGLLAGEHQAGWSTGSISARRSGVNRSGPSVALVADRLEPRRR